MKRILRFVILLAMVSAVAIDTCGQTDAAKKKLVVPRVDIVADGNLINPRNGFVGFPEQLQFKFITPDSALVRFTLIPGTTTALLKRGTLLAATEPIDSVNFSLPSLRSNYQKEDNILIEFTKLRWVYADGTVEDKPFKNYLYFNIR